MKKILFIIFISLSFNSYSQDISGCDSIPMSNETDAKNAEPCVLKLSEYALSEPMTGYSEQAHYARKVVIAWMGETPDYTFSLNSNIMKIFKGDNILLFGTYTCCMANAALTQEGDFSKHGLGLFVEYVTNPKNQVKQSKSIKILIKDWKKGEIDKYIEE